MTLACLRPFGLIPAASPEMNTRAVPDFPPAHPGHEVAPVYFNPDDALNLNDHPKTWNLPDSAVALLARAGEWSARNREYGFVPADMLARFSSDPVQAAEELLRRGIWRRVKGGYQFAEWGMVGETAEAKEQKEAGLAAKRAYDAERQRKSRENRKTARPEAVTGMSRVTSCDAQIDRSDQDLSIAGGQSKSDAQARENPELVTAVADAICAKVGYVPTDDQALAVIAAIRERARKANRRIRTPLKYIPQSVANEPDLYAGLLDGDPPSLAAILADPPADSDGERHEYEQNRATGACWCDFPKSSWRHNAARAAG